MNNQGIAEVVVGLVRNNETGEIHIAFLRSVLREDGYVALEPYETFCGMEIENSQEWGLITVSSIGETTEVLFPAVVNIESEKGLIPIVGALELMGADICGKCVSHLFKTRSEVPATV